jgi:quercetin dioxygenase-like cupin family protein
MDRPSSGDVLRFHLSDERAKAADASTLAQYGRSSRTLVKEGPLRVVLVVVAPGGEIAPHHAGGPITVQVLEGDLRFRAGESEHELASGDMLVVGAGVEHAVRSEGGGAFLLTVVQ